MAQKGYLKVAKDNTGKNGPFVSVLIVDKVDDTDGHWYNIFDSRWFGGTTNKPSPYDIRNYASQAEPTLVVYVHTVSGEFLNITAIRPDAETWVAGTVPGQMPLSEETDKHTAEATEAKQSASSAMTGRQMITGGLEDLINGIGLLVTERIKEEMNK